MHSKVSYLPDNSISKLFTFLKNVQHYNSSYLHMNQSFDLQYPRLATYHWVSQHRLLDPLTMVWLPSYLPGSPSKRNHDRLSILLYRDAWARCRPPTRHLIRRVGLFPSRRNIYFLKCVMVYPYKLKNDA